MQNGKVVSSSGTFFAALGLGTGMVGIIALIVLAGALIGYSLRWLVDLGAGIPGYSAVLSGIGCAALGVLLWVYRDPAKVRILAILQIVIAAASGAAALFTIPEPGWKWIAFAAAVVATADGFNKLRGGSRE
jgi:hypothetical protein